MISTSDRREPTRTNGDRQVALGALRVGARRRGGAATRRLSLNDETIVGSVFTQRDEAARGDGAGADLADVGAVDCRGGVGEGVGRRVPAAGPAGGETLVQIAELHQLRGDGDGRRHDVSSGMRTSQASTPPATSTPAICGPMM